MTQQHLELDDARPADTADWKECVQCGINKPLDAYYRDPYRGDNVALRCRRCQLVFSRFRKYRAGLVRRFYEKQNGLCAVCNKPLDLDDQPHLDHPHSAEAMHDHHTLAASVTGLLHGTCNMGIGLFNDDPAVLRRAAWYIERTRRYGQQKLDL